MLTDTEDVKAAVCLEPTDTDWIWETLHGNPDAFGNLVQKYQPKFLGIAVRILGSVPEAEDVLQDAFIAAYRQLDKFQKKSKFSTWLYAIVLNHIRNRLRHNKVVRWVDIDGMADPDRRQHLEIPEKAVGVEESIDHKLQLEIVKDVVRSFPLQYQSIFMMHYFEGYLLEDISKKLDCPLGTVKAYLHRARKLLTKRLAVKPAQPASEPVGV